MRLNVKDYFMSSESNKQQVKRPGNGKCHINDDILIGHCFIDQVLFTFITIL